MMDPKKLLSWLRIYYHRIIALAVFLGLLASLWILVLWIGPRKTAAVKFKADLDALQPKFPVAGEVDRTPFTEASDALTNPVQLSESPQRLMVPELRVSCSYCAKPIPFKSATCPFCGTQQPEQPLTVDKDKDQMPDDWEAKYGLDPLNATDATKDLDGDGFSNLEEFLANTNPSDPGSYPPPPAKLRVKELRPLPFNLTFVGDSRIGTNQYFQLNMGSNERSYFAEMGRTIEGFKLVGFQRIITTNMVRTMKTTADASVLILESGGKRISLVKHQKHPIQEYVVKLVFLPDGTEFELRHEGEFELRGLRYQVKNIDSQQQRVLIRTISTGEEIWVGMDRQPESPQPVQKRPSASSRP